MALQGGRYGAALIQTQSLWDLHDQIVHPLKNTCFLFVYLTISVTDLKTTFRYLWEQHWDICPFLAIVTLDDLTVHTGLKSFDFW